VIPVIDLRKRFDMPSLEIDQSRRLLIVMLAGRMLGIAVDEVTEVISVRVADIKPPPQVTQSLSAEYLVGVCLVQDDLIMLLNPDRLMTLHETDELGQIEGMNAEVS
jgi:purine-binding chemotaxis protein CheW